MTYINAFVEGFKVEAEDWYRPGIIYLHMASIKPGGAISRPEWEKAFLLRISPDALRDWIHTIVSVLCVLPERRDTDGRLLVTELQADAE